MTADYTGEITIGVAGAVRRVTPGSIPVHPDLGSPFDVGKIAWAE